MLQENAGIKCLVARPPNCFVKTDKKWKLCRFEPADDFRTAHYHPSEGDQNRMAGWNSTNWTVLYPNRFKLTWKIQLGWCCLGHLMQFRRNSTELWRRFSFLFARYSSFCMRHPLFNVRCSYLFIRCSFPNTFRKKMPSDFYEMFHPYAYLKTELYLSFASMIRSVMSQKRKRRLSAGGGAWIWLISQNWGLSSFSTRIPWRSQHLFNWLGNDYYSPWSLINFQRANTQVLIFSMYFWWVCRSKSEWLRIDYLSVFFYYCVFLADDGSKWVFSPKLPIWQLSSVGWMRDNSGMLVGSGSNDKSGIQFEGLMQRGVTQHLLSGWRSWNKPRDPKAGVLKRHKNPCVKIVRLRHSHYCCRPTNNQKEK